MNAASRRNHQNHAWPTFTRSRANFTRNGNLNPLRTLGLLILVGTLLLLLAVIGQAQTFTVLHNFTGGADGFNPTAHLVVDRAGNLYGTASQGGAGYGSVFKLTRRNGAWLFSPIYKFQGGSDGAAPQGLSFAADGSLYGPTTYGGGASCIDSLGTGCGTVFNLRPSPNACNAALCPWTETVLYRFQGSNDASSPGMANTLIFDQAGSIYGTTLGGGSLGGGTVYELIRSGNTWSNSILYNFGFMGGSGYYHYGPNAGVVFDRSGTLWGTVTYGDDLDGDCIHGACGAIYSLTPSGSGWSEASSLLLGDEIYAGLASDASGDLYGSSKFGSVFKAGMGGIYQLPYGNEACGPHDAFAVDPAGNLYGALYCGGVHGFGAIFKLTQSGGTWIYTSLHDFAGGADGAYPLGGVALDANGNIYGTTQSGGSCQSGLCGLVFEIAP